MRHAAWPSHRAQSCVFGSPHVNRGLFVPFQAIIPSAIDPESSHAGKRTVLSTRLMIYSVAAWHHCLNERMLRRGDSRGWAFQHLTMEPNLLFLALLVRLWV